MWSGGAGISFFLFHSSSREVMSGAPYDQKWGVHQTALSSSPKAWIIATVQFVAVALILCILRPGFTLDKTSALKIPQLCVERVVAVAGMICALTYFYPSILTPAPG
tara:strand:+ start:1020 stop:1340 length:321 start_codon:yes stop_codon:yes gene_type:complete